MRLMYAVCILCVILSATVSGCLNPDIYGNKGPRTIESTNEALNATIAVWSSSGHNSTIDTSSMALANVNMIGNETRISTYHFNTTDGKSHRVNVSDYNTTYPVVMDIDNISIA